MSLSEAAFCLGLPAPAENREITGVSIDSRCLRPGDMFICIPGERADGHDFAASAAQNGASAILAQREIPDPGAPLLLVKDSVKALGALAARWRDKTRAKVIGITGTAGKTTLKETLNSILSEAGATAITEKNHNNQIGLPCSILAASGDEDWWIMEAGISRAGDMEELGEILRPDLAIILNAAKGHSEGLGERGAAWHKSRLFNYLKDGGRALASADYPDLAHECDKFPFKINRFSIKDKFSPWRLIKNLGRGRLALMTPDGPAEFQTPFWGDFGAETALAAAAACDLLGIDREAVQRGFGKSAMPENRLSLCRLNGWDIFNDTYNANPLSMKRMTAAAREFAGNRSLCLVLGEMGELGEESARLHFELGSDCASVRPRAVFWRGGHGGDVLRGLLEGGFDAGAFREAENPEDFLIKWRGLIAPDEKGCALFKGSRSQRMESFLEAFKNMPAGGGRHAV